MNIPIGYKFAFVALDNAGVDRNLHGELQLADGAWIVFGPPFELEDYWREWLGTIQVEQLGRASLSIIATAPSNAPNVLDAENESLRERVVSFLYSLFLLEVFHQDGGLIVTGANVNGVISVRQVSKLESHYRPLGVLPLRIDLPWLQNAYAITTGILDVHAVQGSHQRLRRGFRAWVSAMQEYNGEERLHQFVRAVEAIIKPEVGRSRALFVHRGQLFAGNSDTAKVRLGELYDLRGASEHMNPFEPILADYPEAQWEMIALRRSFQAQILASRVYQRIFTDANLQTTFSSDALIQQFWTEQWAVQAGAWGAPVDLDTVADQRFRNNVAERHL